SVAAVALRDRLHPSHADCLITVIAAVDLKKGTLASAHWAKYAIDANLNHLIDIPEAPEGWPTAFFGLGAAKPGEKPKWAAGTEVFELNGKLADYALATTKAAELLDSDAAKEYRKHYPQEAATRA